MDVRGEANAGQRAAAYARAEALLQAMARLVERHEEIPQELADELDACLTELRALGAAPRATSREGSR